MTDTDTDNKQKPKPGLEIAQRVGRRTERGRTIEVKLNVDDIFSTEDGVRYQVAWSVRQPGANLVLLRALSDSQIKEACGLLSSRECEKGWNGDRTVSKPHKWDDE